MQVPTAINETVSVLTVQMVGVAEANVTAFPEAPPVAVTRYVDPATFAAAGAVEVTLIVCEAFSKVNVL